MKELITEEFEKAPTIVQYLLICSFNKMPVGSKIIDEAIEKYPEYFEEEIEHMEKWGKIPDEVHKKYVERCIELHERLFKDFPRKGIVYYSTHIEEWEDYLEATSPIRKMEDEEEKKIYNECYSEYGFTK